MAYSNDLQNDATSLIKEFGSKIYVLKPDGTSIRSTGVRFEVKSEGQAISEQSAFYISGAIKTTVEVGDIIQVGEANYRASAVETSAPAGTPIYYKVLVQ